MIEAGQMYTTADRHYTLTVYYADNGLVVYNWTDKEGFLTVSIETVNNIINNRIWILKGDK